jgi:general secretion pathway protein E
MIEPMVSRTLQSVISNFARRLRPHPSLPLERPGDHDRANAAAAEPSHPLGHPTPDAESIALPTSTLPFPTPATDAATDDIPLPAGELITTDDGLLPLSSDQRTFVAIWANGAVWIRRGQEHHPVVHDTLVRARRLDRPATLRRPISVPAASLARAYASRKSQARIEDTAAAQRQIADLVREYYEAGFSDLALILDGEAVRFEGRIHNALIRLPRDYTVLEAEEMMRGTWYLTNDNVGDYNEAIHQSIGITLTNPEAAKYRWPEGLEFIRVTFWRTGFGTEMHIRMPRGEVAQSSFLALSYDLDHCALLEAAIRAPNGVTWFCGQVGSGKSVSQKTFLHRLYEYRDRAIKIAVIEDTVEGRIPFASQILLPPAQGNTAIAQAYTETFRVLLRGRPDAIMAGESRDLAAVECLQQAKSIGARATTTFHIQTVWMLHQRLKMIGLRDDALYDPLLFHTVVAQDLTRKLCAYCKIPILYSEQARHSGLLDRLSVLLASTPRGFWPWPANAIDNVCVANPQGCEHCRVRLPSGVRHIALPKSIAGMSGRTLVAEVVHFDTRMLELIKTRGPSAARDDWIDRLGGHHRAAHAVKKMLTGILSPATVEDHFPPLDELAITAGLEPLYSFGLDTIAQTTPLETNPC